MRTAWELDPLAPIIRTATGFVQRFFGEFDAAISEVEQVLPVTPSFWPARLILADVLIMCGRAKEGVDMARATIAEAGNRSMVLGTFGHALAASGETAGARSVLSELKEQARDHYVRPYDRARIHLSLDEPDQTLVQLERAVEEGGNWLNYIRQDPVWTPLRGNPGFEAIVRRVFPES